MTLSENTITIQRWLGVTEDGVYGNETASTLVEKLRSLGVVTPKAKQNAVSKQSGGKVSKSGVSLIKHFESCLQPVDDGKFTAYADPGYEWEVASIGWGSTYYPDGSKVERGDILDQADCDDLFDGELDKKAAEVAGLVAGHPTTADQFAALSSFAYNVGATALSHSTLLKRHKQKDYAAAAKAFHKWVYSNGHQLAGLERRRRAESSLYQSLPVDYL